MTKNRLEKRLNLHYSVVHSTYWMYYGTLSGFSSVFMLARGFSNSTIGVVLALSNVIAVVLQLFLANLIDRSERVTLFGTMKATAGLLILVPATLFVIKGASLTITAVYVVGLTMLMVLQPMVNSAKRELEYTGAVINFGLARGMGSLAYSILSSIVGTLAERKGADTIPVAAALVMGIFLINLFAMSSAHRRGLAEKTAGAAARTGPAESGEPGHETISMGEFISRHKVFLVLCLGTLLMYFSNHVINMYMAQIAARVGGTSEDVGHIFALLGIMEVPTMVSFSRIAKRFSYNTLIKVSAIAFCFWIGIVAVGNSVFMLFFAQIAQPFAMALFQPALISFIDKTMDRREAVRGQTMYTIAVTTAAALTGLCGGVVLDLFGAKTLTTGALIITIIGSAIIIAVVDKVGKVRAA